jgi:NAD(P)-dependent dehydrogenase (short-subunit alcohol dehydrogenase family)
MNGAGDTTGLAIALALAALGATAVTGCKDLKEARTLDTTGTEQVIKRGVARDYGAQLVSVKCPKRVDAGKGKTFRCVGKANDGSRLRFKVTQTDDKGDVKWDVAG